MRRGRKNTIIINLPKNGMTMYAQKYKTKLFIIDGPEKMSFRVGFRSKDSDIATRLIYEVYKNNELQCLYESLKININGTWIASTNEGTDLSDDYQNEVWQMIDNIDYVKTTFKLLDQKNIEEFFKQDFKSPAERIKWFKSKCKKVKA